MSEQAGTPAEEHTTDSSQRTQTVMTGRGPGPLRRAWAAAVLPLASILLALVVGALIITASSVAIEGSLDIWLWAVAYDALLEGGLGISISGFLSGEGLLVADPVIRITHTITNSAPLLLAGLSVALGFKAGLFNIGATGQFLMAGLTAALVGAAAAEMSFVFAIPLALLAGLAAGAAYGFIPGLLKATTGAHEVVVTIMLNYIASFTAVALVINLFAAEGYSFDRTADVGNASLPVVLGGDLHVGVIIAYAMVPVFWWFVWKTTLGFEIRTIGANPSAARYAGMSPRRLIMLTMSLCGLLAGLAGVITFLGEIGYYPATFGTAIGFDAIAVALLGRGHPVGVMFGALLFGFFRAGAPLMQIRADIPIEIIDVLIATILFFLAAEVLVRYIFRIRAERGMGEGTQQFTKSYGQETAA